MPWISKWGEKETHLARENRQRGAHNAAETRGDSGMWKVAIDLLTQFGRLGDGAAAASLRETIAADLLKAAGSKAGGDATTRREALNLLSQLDRVSKANVNAAYIRRRIEGRDYFETAAASVKAGAFQEAADNYLKASQRSYAGSADRLRAARVLAAADALLNNDKSAEQQLQPAAHRA